MIMANNRCIDNNPYRGYLSSMQGIVHFGLEFICWFDSVVIKWNNGKQQIIENVKANQVLTVDIKNAKIPYILVKPVIATDAIFKAITREAGISYRHHADS